MAVCGLSGKNYGNSQYLSRHAAHVLVVPCDKWMENGNRMAVDLMKNAKQPGNEFFVIPEIAEQDAPHGSANLELRENILRMPFFSLKKEAKRIGIDTNGKKTFQLREEIISKLAA